MTNKKLNDWQKSNLPDGLVNAAKKYDFILIDGPNGALRKH